MWTAIAQTNPENLLRVIAEFRDHLDELTDAVSRDDKRALLRFFQLGARWGS
jgi:prephenate dehydrogenase